MIDLRTTALVSALALIAVPAYAQDTGGQTGQQQRQATGQQQGSGQTPRVSASDSERRPAQMARPGGALDRQARDMQAGQDGQMGTAGTTVMLDIEGFSQELYERGFRQGYIRGLADARGRFLRELAEYNRRTGDDVATDVASPAAGMAASQMAPEGEDEGQDDMNRGAIVVLPPGVSPQMFLERLQAMNDATQQGGTRPDQMRQQQRSGMTGGGQGTTTGSDDRQRQQQATTGGGQNQRQNTGGGGGGNATSQ